MMDWLQLDVLLSAVRSYGPPALGLMLFLSGLILPIPSTLLILAAGALARQGIVDWRSVVSFGLLGVILGDSGSYAIGRLAGDRVGRLVKRFNATAWEASQARFNQFGLMSIYLSRWLFTNLDWPTNFVAGSYRYPYRRFLVGEAAGRVSWMLLYGGLGYIAGGQWEAISRILTSANGWLAIVVIIILANVWLFRRLRPRAQMGVTESPKG